MSDSNRAPIDLQNRAAFDAVAGEYNTFELNFAEQKLLGLFRGKNIRMLDLGVGTGRTAYTFSPLAEEYVGIDYSSAMIDRCKNTLPPSEHVKFCEGDARDIHFPPSRFDLVLFSYNGIDYVEMDDRIKILREVKRVLKPAGVFLFSSHSLDVFPFVSLPRSSWKRPLLSLVRKWRRRAFYRRIELENRGQNLDQARLRGWAVVNDGAHDFTLRTMYVTPVFQCAQLSEQGYEVEAVLDARGRAIVSGDASNDCWLHYMCRRSAAPQ